MGCLGCTMRSSTLLTPATPKWDLLSSSCPCAARHVRLLSPLTPCPAAVRAWTPSLPVGGSPPSPRTVSLRWPRAASRCCPDHGWGTAPLSPSFLTPHLLRLASGPRTPGLPFPGLGCTQQGFWVEQAVFFLGSVSSSVVPAPVSPPRDATLDVEGGRLGVPEGPGTVRPGVRKSEGSREQGYGRRSPPPKGCRSTTFGRGTGLCRGAESLWWVPQAPEGVPGPGGEGCAFRPAGTGRSPRRHTDPRTRRAGRREG